MRIKYMIRILIFWLVFFQINVLVAQVKKTDLRKFDRAQTLFYAGNYYMTLLQLKEIIERNPDYLDAVLLMAETYNKLDSTRSEIDALEKASKLSENLLIHFRLGLAAYSVGEYQKALKSLLRIQDAYNSNTERKYEIEKIIENCRFAIEARKNPVNFNPEVLSKSVNSSFDEYWPGISIDKSTLVFTRLIKSPPKFPQEDFYISKRDSNGWGKAQPLTEINTNQNEGAQCLSADGKILFFTACSKYDGKGSCDIYISRLEDGKWSNPENAGDRVNTKYWDSQPSFSSDYRYLYISSSRPGGKGKKDIWRIPVSGMNDDGSFIWGEPENPGDSINTEGNEISPFIHANNKQLYFASDYRTGMGKHDLFVSEILSSGKFTNAKNLGYPINTHENEQGLNISADGIDAFYASGKNKDAGLDIFRFTLDKTIRPKPVTFLKAKIVDKGTNQPIKARVELIDLMESTNNSRTLTSDKNGDLFLCIPVGSNYALNVSAPDYLFYSQSFNLEEIKTIYNPYHLNIGLDKIAAGTEMNLYNIYFDVNSYKILPESDVELFKLIDFLKNNDSLVIQIQGHTDDTGSEADNMKLSENRARAVVDFLTDNNIDSKRLSFKGFGESRPVSDNETEEGRKLNRRTTVLIESK